MVGNREILAAAKTRVVSTAVRTTATLGPPATKRKPEYQGTPTTIGSPELTTEGTPAVDHNNRFWT